MVNIYLALPLGKYLTIILRNRAIYRLIILILCRRGCLSRRHTWRFYTPIAAIGKNRQVCPLQRLRFSPIAYKIADIWHVRYRRLNSPAFAKCARSRDFPHLLLRIASKANPSGWAILSHEFSKLPHRRDRRKNRQVCPHHFRWRSNSPRSAYKIARCVAGFK